MKGNGAVNAIILEKKEKVLKWSQQFWPVVRFSFETIMSFCPIDARFLCTQANLVVNYQEWEPMSWVLNVCNHKKRLSPLQLSMSWIVWNLIIWSWNVNILLLKPSCIQKHDFKMVNSSLIAGYISLLEFGLIILQYFCL